MDLFTKIRKYGVACCRRICILAAGLLLSACAAAPSAQPETPLPVPEAETAVEKPVQKAARMVPLTPELMYYILTAELAGQRGDVQLAAELYAIADNKVASPTLAERTAQVANFSRDKKRIERALQRWLEVAPDNPRVYVLQLPYLLMNKDFSAAVTAVDKALALAPEQAQDILAQVVRHLIKLTDARQGLDLLRKLAGYQQRQPQVLLSYARLAAYYQRFEQALAHVDQVLKQQPDNEDAQVLKASILQQTGQLDQAIALLKAQLDRPHVSDDLRFTYAKLLGERGQYAKARQIFMQLNEKLPDNKEILFALGLLALDEKKPKEAKSYFSRLVAMGDPGGQASYFMGLTEEMDENVEKALIWFASVPARSARFDEAQKHYVRLQAQQGQLEKARLHLKLLRQQYPEKAAHYYWLEGSLLREQGQRQAALDIYTEALKAYPENADLLYARAIVAESLNRLALFEQDLKKILQQQPDNAVVLNALGYGLADRTNRYQEALALIQRAVELSPQDAYYLDSLGWVYYKMGDMDKALHYLEKAVALKQDVELMAHLGEVLWINGQQRRAKRIWQQAKKRKPDDALLLKTLRRFGQ